MPWKTFLQAHWEGLAACDLFAVEVLTPAGLRRYLVFFVIALQSRRVTIAGIHPQPYGAWMEQMARNLTDPVDGCLRSAHYLIHDRDPLYTRVFGEILEGGGVQSIRLPPKSPNLNAYAERFVRSIKEGCLSRVVPLGEGHLRLLVREYVEHYHREGCVATSGLRRQDGPPLASTVPGPPSCPATIRSNGASSNPPSSSSAFGGTCGMP